jgi:hypothetical protein
MPKSMKSKRGGSGRGQGRKPLPEYLQRIKLNDFRLPRWIVQWLKSQPESGSHLIEKAVIEKYNLTRPDGEQSFAADSKPPA